VSSLFLKNMFQELCQILTFRGWRIFLNSPTLAPRGSGLTPTIRFHEYFGNLVKNVTLGHTLYLPLDIHYIYL
jgi:hypothetical protein